MRLGAALALQAAAANLALCFNEGDETGKTAAYARDKSQKVGLSILRKSGAEPQRSASGPKLHRSGLSKNKSKDTIRQSNTHACKVPSGLRTFTSRRKSRKTQLQMPVQATKSEDCIEPGTVSQATLTQNVDPSTTVMDQGLQATLAHSVDPSKTVIDNVIQTTPADNEDLSKTLLDKETIMSISRNSKPVMTCSKSVKFNIKVVEENEMCQRHTVEYYSDELVRQHPVKIEGIIGYADWSSSSESKSLTNSSSIQDINLSNDYQTDINSELQAEPKETSNVLTTVDPFTVHAKQSDILVTNSVPMANSISFEPTQASHIHTSLKNAKSKKSCTNKRNNNLGKFLDNQAIFNNISSLTPAPKNKRPSFNGYSLTQRPGTPKRPGTKKHNSVTKLKNIRPTRVSSTTKSGVHTRTRSRSIRAHRRLLYANLNANQIEPASNGIEFHMAQIAIQNEIKARLNAILDQAIIKIRDRGPKAILEKDFLAESAIDIANAVEIEVPKIDAANSETDEQVATVLEEAKNGAADAEIAKNGAADAETGKNGAADVEIAKNDAKDVEKAKVNTAKIDVAKTGAAHIEIVTNSAAEVEIDKYGVAEIERDKHGAPEITGYMNLANKVVPATNHLEKIGGNQDDESKIKVDKDIVVMIDVDMIPATDVVIDKDPKADVLIDTGSESKVTGDKHLIADVLVDTDRAAKICTNSDFTEHITVDKNPAAQVIVEKDPAAEFSVYETLEAPIVVDNDPAAQAAVEKGPVTEITVDKDPAAPIVLDKGPATEITVDTDTAPPIVLDKDPAAQIAGDTDPAPPIVAKNDPAADTVVDKKCAPAIPNLLTSQSMERTLFTAVDITGIERRANLQQNTADKIIYNANKFIVTKNEAKSFVAPNASPSKTPSHSDRAQSNHHPSGHTPKRVNHKKNKKLAHFSQTIVVAKQRKSTVSKSRSVSSQDTQNYRFCKSTINGRKICFNATRESSILRKSKSKKTKSASRLKNSRSSKSYTYSEDWSHSCGTFEEEDIIKNVCDQPLVYMPLTNDAIIGTRAFKVLFSNTCLVSKLQYKFPLLDKRSQLVLAIRAMMAYGNTQELPENMFPKGLPILSQLEWLVLNAPPQPYSASHLPVRKRAEWRQEFMPPNIPEPGSRLRLMKECKVNTELAALIYRQAYRVGAKQWVRGALSCGAINPLAFAQFMGFLAAADDDASVKHALQMAPYASYAGLRVFRVLKFQNIELNETLFAIVRAAATMPQAEYDLANLINSKMWAIAAVFIAHSSNRYRKYAAIDVLKKHKDVIVQAAIQTAIPPDSLGALVDQLRLLRDETAAYKIATEHLLNYPDAIEEALTFAMPALNWKPLLDHRLVKALGGPEWVFGLLVHRRELWVHAQPQPQLHSTTVAMMRRSGVEPSVYDVFHQVYHKFAKLGRHIWSAALDEAFARNRYDVAVSIIAGRQVRQSRIQESLRVIDINIAYSIISMQPLYCSRGRIALANWIRKAPEISAEAMYYLWDYGNSEYTPVGNHAPGKLRSGSHANESILRAIREYAHRHYATRPSVKPEA